MTYKQIEASREARLWIGQVIVPAVTCVTIAMANPEVRKAVTTKFNSVKESIKKKFKKERAQCSIPFTFPYAGYENSMYSDKVIAMNTLAIMERSETK